MSDMSAEGRRDPAVLRALLDRVQAANGPDREIDADVMAACFGWAIRKPPYLMPHCPGEEPIYWHAPDWALKHSVPVLTASIDACVTLLRHALPQSFWSVCDMEDGPVAILVRPTAVGYIGGGVHAKAATPPLAFLAALLKSLIANTEEGR